MRLMRWAFEHQHSTLSEQEFASCRMECCSQDKCASTTRPGPFPDVGVLWVC